MLITTFGLRRVGNHLIRRWISPHMTKPAHIFGPIRKLRLKSDMSLEKEVVTCGVEDYSYEELATMSLDQKPYAPIEQSNVCLSIVRDPINAIASHMQLAQRPLTRPERATRGRRQRLIPKEHGLLSPILNYPLKFSKFLTAPPNGRVILYEEFVKSKSYRDELAEFLGITPHEEELSKHSMNTKGSSFTGTDLAATEMPVNERWLDYINNQEYLWYLNYPGFLQDREKVYGPLPPKLKRALEELA